MRQTRQQELIRQIVYNSPGHVTVRDVYREARRFMPRIGLATVYRHLEVLVRQGVLRKVVLGDRVARYDINTGRHYHIRCVDCGRIDDLPVSFMDELQDKITQSVGYQVLDHVMEVLGRCPACLQGVSGQLRVQSK